MRRPALGVATVLTINGLCMLAPFVGLWLLILALALVPVVWAAWGDDE